MHKEKCPLLIGVGDNERQFSDVLYLLGTYFPEAWAQVMRGDYVAFDMATWPERGDAFSAIKEASIVIGYYLYYDTHESDPYFYNTSNNQLPATCARYGVPFVALVDRPRAEPTLRLPLGANDVYVYLPPNSALAPLLRQRALEEARADGSLSATARSNSWDRGRRVHKGKDEVHSVAKKFGANRVVLSFERESAAGSTPDENIPVWVVILASGLSRKGKKDMRTRADYATRLRGATGVPAEALVWAWFELKRFMDEHPHVHIAVQGATDDLHAAYAFLLRRGFELATYAGSQWYVRFPVDR